MSEGIIEIKKQYTYGEIVAVGRKLRRYENILNNAEQFNEALWFEFQNDDLQNSMQPIFDFVIRQVAKYRKIYDNMLNSLK